MVNDQAAGLRRIFSPALPGAVAIVPCSAVTTSWLAGGLRDWAFRFSGQRVLILDEWMSYGNVGDCLGMAAHFDLLQAVDRLVSGSECVRSDADGLAHVRVAGLVNALVDDRIRTRRCLDLLKGFCADYDKWIVVPSLENIFQGFSPFLRSASDVVLVLDAHPKSVTVAWSALQRLRESAEGGMFCVCQIGSRAEASKRLVTDFCSLAQGRLGISLEVVTSIDQVLDRPDRQAASSSVRSFVERFEQVCVHVRPDLCEWNAGATKLLPASTVSGTAEI